MFNGNSHWRNYKEFKEVLPQIAAQIPIKFLQLGIKEIPISLS
jgi:hypothetical protein